MKAAVTANVRIIRTWKPGSPALLKTVYGQYRDRLLFPDQNQRSGPSLSVDWPRSNSIIPPIASAERRSVKGMLALFCSILTSGLFQFMVDSTTHPILSMLLTHTTSGAPVVNKRLLISSFCFSPAFVHFTIAFCVSRDWMKTTNLILPHIQHKVALLLLRTVFAVCFCLLSGNWSFGQEYQCRQL